MIHIALMIRVNGLTEEFGSVINTNITKFYKIYLLTSTYIRRKYWIRENFPHSVFDGFTCFEMS